MWLPGQENAIGGSQMVIDVLPTTILHYPEPCLRQSCQPFDVIDDSVAALAHRMLEIMHAGHGVGLAGPQVGVTRKIFVCNPTGQPDDDMIFINPELSDLTGAVEAEEGCLSCPDVTVAVRRARRCRIQAVDLAGQPIEMEAEDLLARIWQHECDQPCRPAYHRPHERCRPHRQQTNHHRARSQIPERRPIQVKNLLKTLRANLFARRRPAPPNGP